MFEAARQGTVFVVTGDDPLNVDNVDAARKSLDQCLTKRQPKVVFDLTQIRLMDSVGLELLTETRRDCVRRGGQFLLANPNALNREILRMTGLDGQFDVFDSVLNAVGSFAR